MKPLSCFLLLLALGLCRKLDSVILFTRHGARAPTAFTERDLEYWTQIGEGELTDHGFQQHIQLGSQYRQMFGYKLNIVDKHNNCNYESMDVVASVKSRVILSTIGFITGFCSGNYPAILKRYFNEYYSQYSTNQKDLQSILNSNFDGLNIRQYLENFVINPDFMFHGHVAKNCPLSNKIKEQFEQSEQYLAKQRYFQSLQEFQEVVEILNQAYPSGPSFTLENTTLSDLKELQGDYKCNLVQGNPFPQPSLQAVKLLTEVAEYQFYEVDNGDLVQHKASVSQIFQWVIKALLSNDQKFHWYSGHDSNQVAIFSIVLTQKQMSQLQEATHLLPPFAAHVTLTIDQNDLVNLFYNGQILSTNFCKEEINCTKQMVIEFLNQFIVDDLQSYCRVE